MIMIRTDWNSETRKFEKKFINEHGEEDVKFTNKMKEQAKEGEKWWNKYKNSKEYKKQYRWYKVLFRRLKRFLKND